MALGLLAILMIPIPNASLHYSKALYATDGSLLSAVVSKDQQWCLPLVDKIPPLLAQCIVIYEDEYLYLHPGINPIAMVKAAIKNNSSGLVKRGASTLAMQVMRMKNKHVKRSYFNKIYESLAAIKYTLLNSQQTIIQTWAQLAPFGGNTVGAQSAAMRYFGRDLAQLSVSEYALLAVMPNNPSMLHLSKNRARLKHKRDLLLQKLASKGIISPADAIIYQDEPLPNTLEALPQQAYHMLRHLITSFPSQNTFKSSIDPHLQSDINQLLQDEIRYLRLNDINNTACTIIDLRKDNVVAYIGNIPDQKGQISYVDINHRPRSYGSLLKPLLYAYAIESGNILPDQLLFDIPTYIGDYMPKNFDEKYRGAIPASEFVTQSLNVPAVRLLQEVGLNPFYDHLQDNFTLAYLNKGADHYGLSLILGGGESSLWSLANAYKRLGQAYFGYSHHAEAQMIHAPKPPSETTMPYSKYTLHQVIQAMSNVTRPREEAYFSKYSQAHKIAWKTGTSFGHRDAWAIGFNDKYLVAIWVGNENGEGRTDLTGISKAAPLLFNIFNKIGEPSWTEPQVLLSQKQVISICLESGCMASKMCSKVEKRFVPFSSHKWPHCQYHSTLSLNARLERIPESCKEEVIHKDTIFRLPPEIAYYYQVAHKDYLPLPPVAPPCDELTNKPQIMYPYKNLKLFIPKQRSNEYQEVVAEALAPAQDELYWYVDEVFVGKTKSKDKHLMTIRPSFGAHTLSIFDAYGAQDQINFIVISE